MRKLRLLLVAVLLALPITVGAASPAHACTSEIEPDVCSVVNSVCRKLFGANCLG